MPTLIRAKLTMSILTAFKVISGSPTTSGIYYPSVMAVDGSENASAMRFTITVNRPSATRHKAPRLVPKTGFDAGAGSVGAVGAQFGAGAGAPSLGLCRKMRRLELWSRSAERGRLPVGVGALAACLTHHVHESPHA